MRYVQNGYKNFDDFKYFILYMFYFLYTYYLTKVIL